MELSAGRAVHPCISRGCGHATEAHVRTPELEAVGETVLWCSHCRRHEVRATRWFRGGRRSRLPVAAALPLRAV